MQNAIMKSVPVIEADTTFEKSWGILYTKVEGAMPEVMFCRSESEADDFLIEFEKTGGFLYFKNPLRYPEVEVVEAVSVVKMEMKKASRKTFRSVWMEDDSIVG